MCSFSPNPRITRLDITCHILGYIQPLSVFSLFGIGHDSKGELEIGDRHLLLVFLYSFLGRSMLLRHQFEEKGI